MSTQTPSFEATSEVQTDAGDEQEYEKPRAGVYMMMLLLSFVALMIGSFCLYKEMEAYDFDHNARSAKYDDVQGAPEVPPADGGSAAQP